jgi:hypothetical protein
MPLIHKRDFIDRVLNRMSPIQMMLALFAGAAILIGIMLAMMVVIS